MPDLLQDFSAPVHVRFDYSNAQLAWLLKHSPDAFNRWNAGNRLALNVLLEWVTDPQGPGTSDSVSELNQALGHTIQADTPDQSFLAELLILPSEKDMEEHLDEVDMQKVVSACDQLSLSVAQCLEQDLLRTYQACYREDEYQYSTEEMARRRLQNACFAIADYP